MINLNPLTTQKGIQDEAKSKKKELVKYKLLFSIPTMKSIHF